MCGNADRDFLSLHKEQAVFTLLLVYEVALYIHFRIKMPRELEQKVIGHKRLVHCLFDI